METKKTHIYHSAILFCLKRSHNIIIGTISLRWDYGLESVLQHPTLEALEFCNLGLW